MIIIKQKIIKEIYERLGTEVLAITRKAIEIENEIFTVYLAELSDNDLTKSFLLEEEKVISLNLFVEQKNTYIELK